MNICVLMGSPRLNGNTAEILKPFMNELEINNCDVRYITLHDKKIAPCLGCYRCQGVADSYGCAIKDDMYDIVDEIIKADVLVFATPIYTWQSTAEMKATMDRMYGINKFYGNTPRRILNEGQSYALIATCGYEADYGADLLDEGIRRWCKHSGTTYLGMFAERDVDDLNSFQTDAAIKGAREFAQKIIKYLTSDSEKK